MAASPSKGDREVRPYLCAQQEETTDLGAQLPVSSTVNVACVAFLPLTEYTQSPPKEVKAEPHLLRHSA